MTKAADIDRIVMERAAQPPSPRPPAPKGARPYVAEIGHQLTEGLKEENLRLRAEREVGMVLLKLSPTLIRPTEYGNRHSLSLANGDQKLTQLRESIRAHGQDTPIRVRPSGSGGAQLYELIEGHRRHAAILQLHNETEGGFPILARLDAKAAGAKELVLKMYRENAEREDLSPFETGRMFRQWITSGLYSSQLEISAATALHKTTVGEYLAIAELPDEILQAFRDPRTISLRWGRELKKLADPLEKRVLTRAAQLAKSDPPPTAEAVYKALLSACQKLSKSARGPKLSESVKLDDKVLFTIALKGDRLSLNPRQLESEQLPALYEELKAHAHKWLQARRRSGS